MNKTNFGIPIIKVGFYSGLHSTYQTLATWQVDENKTGYLKDVSFGVASGGETYAQFKLTINNVVKFTDIKCIGGISIPLDDSIVLYPGTIVLLEVKSDGSHVVTANGTIVGRET